MSAGLISLLLPPVSDRNNWFYFLCSQGALLIIHFHVIFFKVILCFLTSILVTLIDHGSSHLVTHHSTFLNFCQGY